MLRCEYLLVNDFVSLGRIILIEKTNTSDYFSRLRIINRGAGTFDEHLVLIQTFGFIEGADDFVFMAPDNRLAPEFLIGIIIVVRCRFCFPAHGP